MMFWQKHPDGCISRKLMKDWNEEEKALHARHGAMVKEAEALGYVFSFDGDTLKWIGRFAPERPWVELVESDVLSLLKDGYETKAEFVKAVELIEATERLIKEKNA